MPDQSVAVGLLDRDVVGWRGLCRIRVEVREGYIVCVRRVGVV
jgi:hypothetical protein